MRIPHRFFSGLLVILLSATVHAAVPGSLNYQGYLTDAAGVAINTNTNITFAIYNQEVGGLPLWSDTQFVTLDQGLFSVGLGDPGNPLPAGLFDTPLWVGINVNGDGEMVPRRPLNSIGFAFESDNALSLQGQPPSAFDQSSHVADMANPHGVSVSQTGADADIANLQSQLDAALATINQLQSDLADEIADRIADVDAEEAARIADVDAEEAARIAADAVHDTAIADIQTNTVLALDGLLTLAAGPSVLVSGANLQVVNDTGTTDGNPNGLGNVIVGYNTIDTDAPICSIGSFDNQNDCENSPGAVWAMSHKSGSHNVIVGDKHNYSRYGGLVVGTDNNITGIGSSVSAGSGNTARGLQSSVTGGADNTASGVFSSVSGGISNAASGEFSSVSGGITNAANGEKSSISGGSSNTASGASSSVSGGISNAASGVSSSASGGQNNTASGEGSSISGGEFNNASGEGSSISGGRLNAASGAYASVAGGGGPSADLDGNEAYADYSTVLGGTRNETGDSNSLDHTIGQASTVSGGEDNIASGLLSSIGGGQNNTATTNYASVSDDGQLQTDIANEIANRIADVDAEEAARMADVNAEESARIAADAVHDTAITDIQTNSVLELDGLLTLSAGPTVLVSGGNLQIVNGTGTTDGAVDGVGNLIVGYNAPRVSGSDKSGSHNLIVGDNHNYSSYGGLVAGVENTISAPSASITGGFENTASGFSSSVSGGISNIASGLTSSVSGGATNEASGDSSSVSGGQLNTASGSISSVSGGRNNTTSGSYASVTGGGGQSAGDGNEAFADYSTVLGGRSNETGNTAGNDRTVGEASTVSGGNGNKTTGLWASVTGGASNTASNTSATVSGGVTNIASGTNASVSGGQGNTATALSSTVSGGLVDSVTTSFDWRGGNDNFSPD